MLGKMSIAQLLTGLPTTEKKSHGIEVVGFLGGSENASPPRVPTSTQTGQVLPPPPIVNFLSPALQDKYILDETLKTENLERTKPNRWDIINVLRQD